jgi:hypothetical protein
VAVTSNGQCCQKQSKLGLSKLTNKKNEDSNQGTQRECNDKAVQKNLFKINRLAHFF